MDIVGVEGLTLDQVNHEVRAGARFVIFQYCFSIIVMTFKRGSSIHFIRSDQNAFARGAPFSLISLILGWWGIPWGPIWTISTIVTNCRGGRDVTAEVLRSLERGTAPMVGAGS